MSIKRVFQTGLVLLLVLSMVFSFAACNNGNETEPTTTVGGADETADPNAKTLAFPKTDFNAEFNILYPDHGIYMDFFFATEAQRGETVAEAILERTDLVYDYLGVDVCGIATPLHNNQIAIFSVAIELSNKVAAGDDAYQMVLAQCFGGVTQMVSEGYLLDFYGMDHINLEADYWNKNAVDDMAVGGVGYYALNDYMISDPDAIFFNKEMLAMYEALENPYTVVSDGRWTLDKMFEMASEVEFDNDGLDDPQNGTYGLTAMADAVFISLIDSCGVSLFDEFGDEKILNMSAGNEKYADLLSKVFTNVAEDWVYLHPYVDGYTVKNDISYGNALFSMESLKAAYKHRESEVVFGILPYPKGSEEQEYRSYDWSGMMAVPNTVGNREMTEKTIEALAFFSQETTKIAYYEKLLGGRLADAPEDKAMLDIIWDSIVLNPAINYMEKPATDLGNLIYSIARGVKGIMDNGKPGFDVSSRWHTYKTGAQDMINQFLNQA